SMRKAVLLLWLMVPALVGAYHYGPGQERLRLDEAARVLAAADRDAASGRWSSAVERYGQALALLPTGRVGEARRIRLERDKAQMLARQLPEARADLKGLVEQLEEDAQADPALRDGARSALANAQYYMPR